MSSIQCARFTLLTAALAVHLTVASRAAGEQQQVKDSLQRDYSGELPRLAPQSPQEAMETFHVAEGFRIEQVAAEPLVTDPVAMAFDENARLFVVEMRGYSEDGDKNLGRIRLLEDTDGDGRFDRGGVYADGLSWPTAITCYQGGVFVGAAPDIFYFKDIDGDGAADVKTKVFTGFGRGNVQGLLNTFKWGLDNRIHGATSSSGAEVVKLPATEQPPLVLRGRDFAIEPRSMSIQPTSGGAQHGMSFDPWGNKFVCSNSNHIQFVLYEDHYLARNPYLAAPGPRISIAVDGPQADVFRTSPVEPWRIVRTRLRKQGIVPGPVERGGKAAGYFTGSTGVTIYRGNDWPRKYYGWAVVADVGSNLVHRKRLVSHGVSFLAHRVDERSEFVSSSDIWFRPVQFANAPDGALYIADMYREVIEHPLSLHPVIKKHLDLTSGRDRGRIYRVVSTSFQQPELPKLGQASTRQLVALLDHPNGWHRETAARLLYERQDLSAVRLLEQQATAASSPEGRFYSLYALHSLGVLSPELVVAALQDPHPRVREHAVKLAEQVAQDSSVRDALYQRVADDDLRVRYQLAFSLGQLQGPQRNQALAQLVRKDGKDGHVRIAILSSLGEGAGAVLAILARDQEYRNSADGKQWLRTLAAQIGRQQGADDIASLLAVLRRLTDNEQEVMQVVIQGLAAKKGSALEQQVAAATGGRAADVVANMLAQAQQTAAAESGKAAERVRAIHLLQLSTFQTQRALFDELLEPYQPAEIQLAALTTLSTFDAPQVAELLVRKWSNFSPSLRIRAGDILFSRKAWIVPLLTAVQQNKIAQGDLEPSRLKLLASHPDVEIATRAKQLLAQDPLRGRAEVLEAYRSVLEMEGDAEKGRVVFQKICAACHRVQGAGHEIGPNLAAMRNRGPEAILLNVLAPNREVNPQYLSYALITADGRTLTGMIAAETATSVTLKRAENVTDTVLRIDIDELRSSGMSLMPEGLEKEIKPQQMADLIAYLQTVD